MTHDDGIVLIQSGLVEHRPARGHINGPIVVRLQHSKTPMEVRLLSEDGPNITTVTLTSALVSSSLLE